MYYYGKEQSNQAGGDPLLRAQSVCAYITGNAGTDELEYRKLSHGNQPQQQRWQLVFLRLPPLCTHLPEFWRQQRVQRRIAQVGPIELLIPHEGRGRMRITRSRTNVLVTLEHGSSQCR